jgi:hypothetical protein
VGGRIAEEWSANSGAPLLGDLAQEIRECERLEQELLVARRIQQASLPKEVPDLEGWEISPNYQSAREVGGDFYDFLELPNGRLGICRGRCNWQGRPCRPGDGQRPQHATCRSPNL